jgi:hypothetical protein
MDLVVLPKAKRAPNGRGGSALISHQGLVPHVEFRVLRPEGVIRRCLTQKVASALVRGSPTFAARGPHDIAQIAKGRENPIRSVA